MMQDLAGKTALVTGSDSGIGKVVAQQLAERGDGATANLTTMVANFGQSGMPLYGSTKAAKARRHLGGALSERP